jgi:hypothetical protein
MQQKGGWGRTYPFDLTIYCVDAMTAAGTGVKWQNFCTIATMCVYVQKIADLAFCKT